MIDSYFERISTLIRQSGIIQTPNVSFDKRDAEIGSIRGDIIFKDGSRLHFREFAQAQQGKQVELYM